MITNEQRHEVVTELQKEILFSDNWEHAGKAVLDYCLKVERDYQEELVTNIYKKVGKENGWK